jgi:hypothetical protein
LALIWSAPFPGIPRQPGYLWLRGQHCAWKAETCLEFTAVDEFDHATDDPVIRPYHSRLLEAVTPLRLIFWGGLLCIFDITFSHTQNGYGFKFDILNDALGVLLILIGVVKLAKFTVDDRYDWAMRFVIVVTVVALLDAIRAHFIMPLPDAVSFALSVFGVVRMATVVVFCVAMGWLCQSRRLPESAASWRVTTWLFVLVYLLPLGLFYVAACYAIATRTSFNLNLGPAGLLLLPVFALPIIHLFVSTSRMKREALAPAPHAPMFSDPDEYDAPRLSDPGDDDWMYREQHRGG